MTISIPNSPVEFLELQRVQQAKDNGFAFFLIRPEDGMPGFVYTIGMRQHDLPELLCYFSTEDMGHRVVGLMTHICTSLIESVGQAGKIPTLRAFCKNKFHAASLDRVYSPTFLQGDQYLYALKNVVTRAVRYRNELGGVPQVIELQQEGVLTLAEQMTVEETLSA